ncbi:AfsR/SARP family transcriptional regulator, partial [Micromonospora yasonensis]|nr:AfsR/SARP family transcriptional regulator [Micromonospora yasonensis]
MLAALGLREQALLARAGRGAPEPVEPLGRLVEALAGRSALLLLDNCEHLLEAAAGLAERLLTAGPRLRVLATSREPLGVTGEVLRPVESLALPSADVDPATALAYPAVRLFADRAGAARADFAVDGVTVGPVVRICRALDGMPLAIELAAARLRSLTAAQVDSRLDDRFRLLTGGSRTALPRHQTLRAVVDWSWDLLDDGERTLWRRLAVFAGGATLALHASNLAVLDAVDGDLVAARAHHDLALDLALGSQDAPVVGAVLVGFADLALRLDRPAAAARLLGAASGVRGGPDHAILDRPRVAAAARAALGEAGFAEAYAGRAGRP